MKNLLSIICAGILSGCTFAVTGSVSKNANPKSIAAGAALIVAIAAIVILHQQPAPMPPIMPSDAQSVDYEPNNDCLPKHL